MALTQVPIELSSTPGIVDNSNATAITIDSSENVLVGMTSASTTVDGLYLRPGTNSGINASGSHTLTLNRRTNDGDILKFDKDGTTIGSIAVAASNNLAIDGLVASHAGLEFGTGRITPRVAGATADNAVDLGYSTQRFKDLYLSGKLFINNDIQMNQQNGRFDYDGGSSGGAIRFFSTSANTERARLTSAGAFILNTTGIPNGNQDAIYLDASGGDRFSSRNNTSARHHLVFKNPNGEVGRIETSGTSTSYVTSSDHRLKENVVVMSGATERLKQLKPSRFNFIADAETTVDGFLAHEVADVVPEAISGTKDAVDSEGNPVYQGIDQSKLVPLLVATIQELEARITQLENN